MFVDGRAYGGERYCNIRGCNHGEKLVIKLSFEPALHQLHLGPDVSDFYQSGVLPLHYKPWYSMRLEKMHKIAKIRGECFLQPIYR